MNCKARQRKVTSIIFFVCEKNYFSTLCRRFRVKRGYPHVGKLMNIIIFAIFKNQFVVLSHDLSAQRFLDAINSSSREKSYFLQPLVLSSSQFGLYKPCHSIKCGVITYGSHVLLRSFSEKVTPAFVTLPADLHGFAVHFNALRVSLTKIFWRQSSVNM